MVKTKKGLFAMMCIVIVCAIAIPAIIGEFATDDLITVNTITQTTTLGNNTTYLITLTNIGNENETFNLTAINIDNVSVASLSQTTITLDTGQSGDLLLNVTDELIPGPYCVLVNATSQTTVLSDEVVTTTAVVEEW